LVLAVVLVVLMLMLVLAQVEEQSWSSRLQYAGFATLLLAAGYLFANLVPFFDEMLGAWMRWHGVEWSDVPS
jgi:hypothetical protein